MVFRYQTPLHVSFVLGIVCDGFICLHFIPLNSIVYMGNNNHKFLKMFLFE
jgi:hypothetical protein